jgi:hypothetical protein
MLTKISIRNKLFHKEKFMLSANSCNS